MRFRMVDRIDAYQARSSISGAKTVSFEEYSLRTALGCEASLPESLLLESLFQRPIPQGDNGHIKPVAVQARVEALHVPRGAHHDEPGSFGDGYHPTTSSCRQPSMVILPELLAPNAMCGRCSNNPRMELGR